MDKSREKCPSPFGGECSLVYFLADPGGPHHGHLCLETLRSSFLPFTHGGPNVVVLVMGGRKCLCMRGFLGSGFLFSVCVLSCVQFAFRLSALFLFPTTGTNKTLFRLTHVQLERNPHDSSDRPHEGNSVRTLEFGWDGTLVKRYRWCPMRSQLRTEISAP